jgi:hypothetical protein
MHFKSTTRMLLLAIFIPFAAQAQTSSPPAILSVPHMTEDQVADQLRQATTPIYDTPPTMTLVPHSPQAHPGKIWLVATDSGLHVWGKVEAGEQGFHWPEEQSEMLSSDHIEVWLATEPEVQMPQIGWGNQFGQIKLDSAKDCTARLSEENNAASDEVRECVRWYDRQPQYRKYLERLFIRQWLVAGQGSPSCCVPQTGHWFEDFASTAWSNLSTSFFKEDRPAILQPKSEDGFQADMNDQLLQEIRKDAQGNPVTLNVRSGYLFHLFIPYTAFPPAQQLKLTDLYFAVDVFSAAPLGQTSRKMGDYATTAPDRQWGKPATFNHLQLAAPRTFSISPCQYKPEQTDLYDESHPAWYFLTAPGQDSDLNSTFALIDPAGGYMYEPTSVSPQAVEARYFWKKLANGATLCGPNLAWRKGAAIKRTDFPIDEKSLREKTLPDGWTLLRSGPTTRTLSAFGSGQCGACTMMDLDFFAVSPQGDVSPALRIDQSLSGQGDSPQAADLTIAPDWKRITLFLEYEDYQEKNPDPGWTSVTYCLNGHEYQKCDESKKAMPPDPPHFKELRGDN